MSGSAVAAVLLSVVLAACHGVPAAPTSPATPEPSDGLRESGAARFARTHPDFAWATHDTESARLYAEAGPGTADRLAALAQPVEAALRRSRAYVGRRYPTGRISLFFVDSRERMGDLLGRTPGGTAIPKEDVALFVAPPDGHAPALVHELTHLEAWETFGERPVDEPWFDEGLATASVGRCYAYTLDEAGAAVVREGRAVPLAELAASFDVADPGAYLQAGSVVAWVKERWGLDAVAALWRGGLAASERATGLTAEALDAAWRAHVVERDPGTTLDWTALTTVGCEAVPSDAR